MAGYIEVDGITELQRAVRRAVDVDLPKRLGQANKEIGEVVIRKLTPPPDPRAVGEGAGATVRPSATRREVVLRVGGAHRSAGARTALQPWGKRRVKRQGAMVPKRPFIQGTAVAHQEEISHAWLEAIANAMRPAFAEVEP